MNSNFAFLKKYWPDMAEIGNTAELYLHTDANACLYKLGLLAESIVTEIIRIENVSVPEEATFADKIRALKYDGILPANIDNILYVIRKARNNAAHSGLNSQSEADTLLRMAFKLSIWFMTVYGDWDFNAPAYVVPEKPISSLEMDSIIKEQEKRISELSSEIERMQTSAEGKEPKERSKKAEEVSSELSLSDAESQYLHSDDVRMDIVSLPAVNYALQLNRIDPILKVTIQNNSEIALENVTLHVFSTPGFALPFERNIEFIPPQGELCLKDVKLMLDVNFLAQLSEKVLGVLRFSLTNGDVTIVSEDVELSVLCFDQWHGSAIYPELLTSFVTPNHPEISKLITKAARYLGSWTGDPSLDAYQSKDVNRVLKQAAAVYAALQSENIIYAVPPASFEKIGQRIRLCDAVIQQRLGTCMDLTLMYTACLEAIGLHPIMVLQKGHIFGGLWLDELSFPEAVQDDVSLITKRLAEGVNEIAVVECTAFVAGKDMSFNDAMKAAEKELLDESKLECIIDVFRSRQGGITPLPLRIRTNDGWHVENPNDQKRVDNAPKSVMGSLDVQKDMSANQMTKKAQWERKLLDLGLRNSLINMRLSRTMLPLMASSIDELENALSDGTDFSVLPRPEDWKISTSQFSLDNLHELRDFDPVLKLEFKNKRLRSIYSPEEHANAIKALYRAARTSLEENGANTLYMALGLLKWYETSRSVKARYAPIVLIPIEMVRKSAAQGYVIRLRDDEPQMNITILEKLRQDFNIVVNGLDPLPEDAHGVDIRKVFTILRKSIMTEPRWDVLESAYLGIFSFSQFVMWNDLRNRADDLVKNKIVRSLMDGKLAWAAHEISTGDHVPEDNVYLPIPADASQLNAIEAASNGESFVLHGPPGTGKSQTITALIANALAQGKTVLFVAEKMAALEVVQKRLNALGIGPFCLELHSNTATKKDVLEQLRVATEVTKSTSPEEYALKATRLASLRKELDSYAHELHHKLNCGLSLFDLVNRYEEYSDATAIKGFDPNMCGILSSIELADQSEIVERLIAAGRAVGHPHDHSLSRIKCTQYSQQLRFSLDEAVENYRQALSIFKTSSETINRIYRQNTSYTYSYYQILTEITKELSQWEDIPEKWAAVEDISGFTTAVKTMAQHFIKANAIEEELSKRWNKSFLDVDAEEVLYNFNQAETKWALFKALETGKIIRSLTVHSKVKADKQTAVQDTKALVLYQQEIKAGNELLSIYSAHLGDMYSGDATDWGTIYRLTEKAYESGSRLDINFHAKTIRQRCAGDKSLLGEYRSFLEAKEAVEKAKAKIYNLLGIQDDVGASDWIVNELKLCNAIQSNSHNIREWITWNSVCTEASKKGLSPVIAAYEDGMDHDDIVPAYKRAVYQAMAIYAIDHSEALNTFSGTMFNEKIEQYKKIDKDYVELTKKEIFCRLAARVPNFTREAAQSSELGILQRAIRSNARGISIRKLLDQIPELLVRLCPCMLMSPISAAQYLDPKRKPFDIVVFDEASQLPTCKAVGALARGENAIIVGDPKQMPPTSFFQSNTLDEENLELEDLESILDDCLAINMPQTHLLWHYRSRHESLIAFSNSQFYENKLYTFPSVNDRAMKVQLVHVDGIFTRGKSRVNREEAAVIIDDLKHRCHDPELSQYSVGIVTFNATQQNLIEDMLNDACAEDADLERWAYETEEPIFIKNLENVQGDERDVILFSIGYGPDENGKVYMNFGPLNREGGWRRLNVAVSRARQEMTVYSTLTPDQINLSKTNAAGVAALKLFLEYASGRDLPQDENLVLQTKQSREGIIHSICMMLKEQGYQTDSPVGHSKYKIDIGVVDPRDPNGYVAGILLDGDNYETAKTTRDREIAQVSVLNSLGWKILRIWTMDWWDNKKKELNRILQFVKDAEDGMVTVLDDEEELPPIAVDEDTGSDSSLRSKAEPLVAENVSKKELPYESSADNELPVLEDYKAAELPSVYVRPEDFITHWYDKQIIQAVYLVLQQEAPICESMLIRRVIQSFGIARSGSRIQDKMDQILPMLNLKCSRNNNQTIYWWDDQKPSQYNMIRTSGEGNNKRDAKEVPIEEVINAIRYVLIEQLSLSDDDLIREAAKLLGYTRLGNNVEYLIRKGIHVASNSGVICRGTNMNWKLNDQ